MKLKHIFCSSWYSFRFSVRFGVRYCDAGSIILLRLLRLRLHLRLLVLVLRFRRLF